MRDIRFFDTSILCYAYSTQDPDKRKVCERLVEKVFNGELNGAISNQVLGEFFNASVNKLLMPIDEVKVVVQYLITSDKWQKIDYTHKTIEKVIQRLSEPKAPFWDIVIAQTMKENGITEIITENEKDFNRIPGIKITNPFKP